MKKKYRIRSNEEFQEIIAHRKFATSKNFVIYTKDKKEEYARFGIAVPKKVANAVMRNKIKRQVKSFIQAVYKEDMKKDVILIVKKPYLDASYQDNEKDLEKLIKKVKI
ncbi:MAG: ribonuclease P protein component [Erysipelothrix sp.]|nr:ribonuclease P protein component [Erysipelothrix sp.]